MTFIALAAAQADPYVDEFLKSDFYGPILNDMKLESFEPAQSCCDKLKVRFLAYFGNYDVIMALKQNDS